MSLTPDQVVVPKDAHTVQVLTDEVDRWWSARSFAEKLSAYAWATSHGIQRAGDQRGEVIPDG